jgi:hypothetical protein
MASLNLWWLACHLAPHFEVAEEFFGIHLIADVMESFSTARGFSPPKDLRALAPPGFQLM